MKRLIISGIFIVVAILLLMDARDAVSVLAPDEVNEEDFLVIAHRGASMYAPEHTMAAYDLAFELDADYLEIDLQMTADGVLVAMHDDTVDRTTDGEGAVSDYNLDELQALDAGSWFNEEYPDEAKEEYAGQSVPTLEEIFEHFKQDANYYIETKEPGPNAVMEKELLRLLEKYDLITDDGQVIIQSFSTDSLQYIDSIYPDIPLIQLQREADIKEMDTGEFQTIASYADGVGPSFRFIHQQYVQDAREADLAVHPYTVDDPKDIERLRKWGATGVFTNDIHAVK